MLITPLSAAWLIAQASDSSNGLQPWINTGGIVGILLLVIVFGIQRKWVFGWQYDAVVKERDMWRELAMKGTSAAESAAGTAQTLARQKEREAESARLDLIEMGKLVDEARRRGMIR